MQLLTTHGGSGLWQTANGDFYIAIAPARSLHPASSEGWAHIWPRRQAWRLWWELTRALLTPARAQLVAGLLYHPSAP